MYCIFIFETEFLKALEKITPLYIFMLYTFLFVLHCTQLGHAQLIHWMMDYFLRLGIQHPFKLPITLLTKLIVHVLSRTFQGPSPVLRGRTNKVSEAQERDPEIFDPLHLQTGRTHVFEPICVNCT